MSTDDLSGKQRAFLAAFAETGNVRLACQTADVGRTSHYRWLGEDSDYAEAFRGAEEDGCRPSGGRSEA